MTYGTGDPSRVRMPNITTRASCLRRILPALALAAGLYAQTLSAASAAFFSAFPDDLEKLPMGSSIVLAQASMDDLFDSNAEKHESSEDNLKDSQPALDEAEGDVTSSTLSPEANRPPSSVQDEGATDQNNTAEENIERALNGSAIPAEGTNRTDVRVSGFVQNELGYTYSNPDHISKFRTLAKVRLNGRLSERVKWQIGGSFSFDPNFQFNHFYPDDVRNDQKINGYIDETFLDIDANQWELRLGRQHIVWGEMVGLFFADVVSALDLREFVLPDFELIRIPQWAARAEYFNDAFHAELIWLPYVTGNDSGKFGADYHLFPIELPNGIGKRLFEDNMPNDIGPDSGYGARASYLLAGWDMAAFYYTSPDRSPALERRVHFLNSAPELEFFPRHDRIHQFGTTVAKDLGSFVIKAEAVETLDRQISIIDVADSDGLAKSNEMRYIFGLDWAGEGHNANLQLFQTWLQNHRRDMIFKELESGLSVLLSTTRLGANLVPEILWIRSLNRDEWLLEIKATWNMSNHWRATLGADIFEGPPIGLLGEFDAQDRVYYEIRYSF